MNASNILWAVAALLITFGVISQIYAYFLFKKNKENFEYILNEFKRRGLQLDITTSVATHFSDFFHYNKVAYIARIYNGVTLYHKKNEKVSAETYGFVQHLPAEKIDWLVRLHKINMFNGVILFSGAIIILLFKWGFIK